MGKTTSRLVAVGVAALFILDGVAAMVMLDLITVPGFAAREAIGTTPPPPPARRGEVHREITSAGSRHAAP